MDVFIDSEELKNRIQAVSEEIALRSNGKITFEEYISLPYYGWIILRFNLREQHYTIADLDRYEAMMYDCVKDEFLVDFMGEVYRNAGIDYRRMEELFAKCANFYGDEKWSKSPYAEKLENDARQLLALCGLSLHIPVWEIQIEEQIRLLLLDGDQEALGKDCMEGRGIHVCNVASLPCKGLIAAAFYARRNDISLANALMRVQKSADMKKIELPT